MCPAMAPRPIRTLVNKALGGNLDKILLDAWDANKSFDVLSRELAEQGVDVSRGSLQRWSRELRADRERNSERIAS